MALFLTVTVPAFGIACLATCLLARLGGRFQILDHPNERSLHSTPIPRTGGIAILTTVYIGAALVLLIKGAPELRLLFWVGLAGIVVASVALVDDWTGLSPALRFVTHVAVAGLLIWGGFELSAFEVPGVDWEMPHAISWLVTVFFIVWMINLYNFMDGMDGFAGGMAMIGFGSYALLGWLAAEPLFATLSLIVMAASAGFLVFNFPPARIFMGDTGSSTLGLLVAAFTLWGARDAIFPFWIGLLVFSPFIIDASVTLVRRIAHRDRIWIPHKTHYYQRLVQLGWGHRKTVLVEYGLMVLCAASAVLAQRQSALIQWIIIIFWITAYTGLIWSVEQLDSRAARKANNK